MLRDVPNHHQQDAWNEFSRGWAHLLQIEFLQTGRILQLPDGVRTHGVITEVNSHGELWQNVANYGNMWQNLATCALSKQTIAECWGSVVLQ